MSLLVWSSVQFILLTLVDPGSLWKPLAIPQDPGQTAKPEAEPTISCSVWARPRVSFPPDAGATALARCPIGASHCDGSPAVSDSALRPQGNYCNPPGAEPALQGNLLKVQRVRLEACLPEATTVDDALRHRCDVPCGA